MLKKILFILLLLSSCKVLHAQNYWLRSSFSPWTTMNKIAFTDSTTFFVAADSGKIFYSSDAGINWSNRNVGAYSTLIDITFTNKNTGYVIAWQFGEFNPNFLGSVILKTTNAGLNWYSIKNDTNAFYNKIYFLDSVNGYLGGQPKMLQRTTDAGLTWIVPEIDSNAFSNYPVRNIKFLGATGIACGGWIDIQGVMWRTTNNGLTWDAQGISPEPLYDIHFYNANHIIAVGGDFEFGASMATSTNGGANWNYMTFEEFGTALGLSFRTPSNAWMALGIGQKFLYTKNGGANWMTFATPNGESVFDVKFANNRNGIAVGLNGVILKYNTEYVGIENNNSSLPSQIELKQNYPNPFNPETIISFRLQKPEFVTLKVYDMLGKEMKTLVNGMKIPGEHKINFKALDIPAGVYYYVLKAGDNFSETKKMILLK